MSSRTREKLLEAVEDLMCTQGLARIGTRDIACAAELADGTLYNHFRSKDEIVIAVLERNVPKFRETLQDLPLRVGQRTVRQNLEEVADAAFRFYTQVAPLLCSLFADMLLLESARKKLRDLKIGPERAFEVLAAYFAAEQRMGRIACENGFDNAHILIHKDNTIIRAKDWILPLGVRPTSADCIAPIEGDGPKGMMQWLFTDKWEPILENKMLGLKVEGLNSRFYRTSVSSPAF